ncbi:hypothetical protein M0802_000791 [Mischocyttarus mexicanus]|nr:hypothetical protein M0802_000791 [Mischocyttarus mexicanus]
MPTAHLPTPANLPNLNAKSASAPSLRERLAESEIEMAKEKEGNVEEVNSISLKQEDELRRECIGGVYLEDTKNEK